MRKRKRARKSRQGWEQAFADMAQSGDDALLDPETTSTSWDEEEWFWELERRRAGVKTGLVCGVPWSQVRHDT